MALLRAADIPCRIHRLRCRHRDLANPPIDWQGSDTFIQIKGVDRDLGIFDDPDSFYARHGHNIAGIKRALYRAIVRHLMYRRVAAIRASR